MTVKNYALKCNYTERTIQRWIQKFNRQNSTNLPSGLNDEIENNFLQIFLDEKSGLIEVDSNKELNNIFDNKIKEGIDKLEDVIENETEEPGTDREEKPNANVVEFELKKEGAFLKNQKKVIPDVIAKAISKIKLEPLGVDIDKISTDIVEQKRKTLLGLDQPLKDLAERMEADLNIKVVEELHSKELNKNHISPLQQKLSSDWLIVMVLLTILCADMIAFSIIGHNSFEKVLPYPHLIFAVIGLATGIGSIVTYNRIEKIRLANIWKWLFGVLQFCVFSFAINEKWMLAETIMTIMFVLVFIGVQRSIKK